MNNCANHLSALGRHGAFRAIRGVALALLAAILVGCGNEGVNTTQRSIDAMQAIVDLQKSVVDEGSARDATDQIAPAFQEFGEALRAQLEYETEHGEVRGLKTKIDQLRKDMERLQREIKYETQRVDSLKGLPPEFWSAHRQAMADFALTMLDVAAMAGGANAEVAAARAGVEKLQALYAKLGPQRVIEVEVTGGRADDRAEAMRLTLEKIGSGAESVDVSDPNEPSTLTFAAGPVDDVYQFVESIDYGNPVDVQPERSQFELKVGSNLGGEFAGMSAAERAAKIEEQKEAAKRAAEQAAADRARREQERREREERNRQPRPTDPDYYDKLIEHLVDWQARHHDYAMTQLLRLTPADVTDPELRKKIAIAFRDLALESRLNRGKAIRGLAQWAGKYATPTLIEILNDSTGRADKEVFEALGEYPTPEGAAAAAAQLGNFFNRRAAAQALDAMGPVAEDALIEAAPSDDPKICLTALELLGKYGTAKCLPLLRQARDSGNPDVRQAAELATAKVRRRTAE